MSFFFREFFFFAGFLTPRLEPTSGHQCPDCHAHPTMSTRRLWQLYRTRSSPIGAFRTGGRERAAALEWTKSWLRHSGTAPASNELWISVFLALTGEGQSSTIHFRAAPVWLTICVEWRNEGGVDLSPVKDREPLSNHLDWYPELASRIVVRIETGGRWSEEAVDFVRQLSIAKAEEVPSFMRRSVSLSWECRWTRMLSVVCATAFAASLVEPARQCESICWTGGDAPPLADLLWQDPRW